MECINLDVDVLNIISIFKNILRLLEIGIVVALIIWIMIDIIKLIIQSEVDIKKLLQKMTKRIIAMAVVFLVPLIVDIVFNAINSNTYAKYYSCATTENVRDLYIEQATNAMNDFIYNPTHSNYLTAHKYVSRIKYDNEFSDRDNYLKILDEYNYYLNHQEQPPIWLGISQNNNPGSNISITSDGEQLTASEIREILNSLPSNISSERRKIVEVALDAVGKIPYYWGGTATYPGYEGNDFGKKVSADKKGRTKKGLDCSHYVDWVYWTAIGDNLGNGWTGTLLGESKDIDPADLLPGDLVFDNAGGSQNGNHVGIYVGRDKNGKLLVAHEIPKVVKFNNNYPWTVYRRVTTVNID